MQLTIVIMNYFQIYITQIQICMVHKVIKQIDENNLYEQELANGEEVYLPSAGNFPGGDKILKTGTERVDLISCKFGKSGRTYGFLINWSI